MAAGFGLIHGLASVPFRITTDGRVHRRVVRFNLGVEVGQGHRGGVVAVASMRSLGVDRGPAVFVCGGAIALSLVALETACTVLKKVLQGAGACTKSS